MKKYKIVDKKRFTVSFICFALILLVTVGGSFAVLKNVGSGVTNKFIPGSVSTEVNETLSDEEKSKSNITIKNTGNTSAYIRVAVVQNWVDASGNIIPGELPTLPELAEGWKLGDDGFYYYTSKVAAGSSTTKLFNAAIVETGAPAGTHLQVTILADGIQSQGTYGTNKAVVDAWGVDPSTLQ